MEKESVRILIADDEQSVRDVVAQVLQEDGHVVTTVESGEAALEAFRKDPFPIVLSDIRMGGMTGIDLLKNIKRIRPHTQVLIMTSTESFNSVKEALAAGAHDYLSKPFENLEAISQAVQHALLVWRMAERNRDLKQWVDEHTKPGK